MARSSDLGDADDDRRPREVVALHSVCQLDKHSSRSIVIAANDREYLALGDEREETIVGDDQNVFTA